MLLPAPGQNHTEFRELRNRASRLVKRDKLASNLRHLQGRGFDHKSVWNLANTATGRSTRSTLPSELVDEDSGNKVTGDTSLADCVNEFSIDKVNKIRRRIDGELQKEQQQPQDHHQQQQQRLQEDPLRCRFRAPTEREVRSVILSLNNTAALGIDGIPVVVLKQLAPVIAAPTAHLIKKSF